MTLERVKLEKENLKGRSFNTEDTDNIKEVKEFYVPEVDNVKKDLENAMNDIFTKHFGLDRDEANDCIIDGVNLGRLMELRASIGKIYRHFKGDLYLLIDIAKHTESGEELVIYKALYGDCKVYARPLKMFLEKVPENKLNPTGQEYRLELYIAKSIKEEE